MSLRRRALAVTGLVLLLALGQAAATTAELGILWRVLVLSWDDPATQLQDEKAVAASHRDDLAALRESATGSTSASRRVVGLYAEPSPEPPALRSRPTRAPPA